ncbi:hypothetical protein J4731_23350 [Providencia rettgeri]|nr:hypothetical protein [Providencia rettgeri]
MVDLPKYNLLMAKELSSQWELNCVSEQMVSGMKDLVLKFIKSHEIPKYIKASDLWKAYVDQYQEEAAHEGWGRPLVIISEENIHGKKDFFISAWRKSQLATLHTAIEAKKNIISAIPTLASIKPLEKCVKM